MPVTPEAGSDAPKPPGGGDIDQAIAVLRGRVEEEFRITERFDTKMRQAFALAAGFFAVVQTVAFGSFAEEQVNDTGRLLLGGLAVLAGYTLVVVAHRLVNGEEPLDEEDVRPEAIVRWVNDATDSDYVPVRLVSQLSLVARRRTENNQIRERNYQRVATATRWSLIFAGSELMVAIALRL